jgi:hypothetical protein
VSAAPTAADLAEYEADAQQPAADGENILAKITRVARELREARDEVVHAEEVLKAKQSRVRTIEEFTLPELMREAGQEKLRTSDGYDLELTETLRASVPAANMAEAIAWLTDHNQAAIVKRAMTLKFGRDENDKAQRALSLILEAGFTPEDKQSIHPQTLAAVIRELLAEGVDVPLPLLGAYVQPSVKLKEAKRK